MPKLRTLSGSDLPQIFKANGFVPVSQRGSHIKLRRILPNGVRQTLTIVSHSEVDRGTLHAIYRQALRYIPEAELRPFFHTD